MSPHIEHAGAGWACSTGKKLFTSRRQAKRWNRANRDTWGGGKRRTYRCTECGFVHLTSRTADHVAGIRQTEHDRRRDA